MAGKSAVGLATKDSAIEPLVLRIVEHRRPGDLDLDVAVGHRHPQALAGAPAAATPAAEAKPLTADELAIRQGRLADKYAELEKLLQRLADFESIENPRRAELLRKAAAMSKENFTKKQLDQVVKLLAEQRFNQAIEGQGTAKSDMEELLKLLMSEMRQDRVSGDADTIRKPLA